MTSPVSHSQGVQSVIQGEEFIDDDLDSQTLGNTRPENPPSPPPFLWVPSAWWPEAARQGPTGRGGGRWVFGTGVT